MEHKEKHFFFKKKTKIGSARGLNTTASKKKTWGDKISRKSIAQLAATISTKICYVVHLTMKSVWLDTRDILSSKTKIVHVNESLNSSFFWRL